LRHLIEVLRFSQARESFDRVLSAISIVADQVLGEDLLGPFIGEQRKRPQSSFVAGR
jgi:hypothetical protein